MHWLKSFFEIAVVEGQKFLDAFLDMVPYRFKTKFSFRIFAKIACENVRKSKNFSEQSRVNIRKNFR
jgi:hypothetical protein